MIGPRAYPAIRDGSCWVRAGGHRRIIDKVAVSVGPLFCRFRQVNAWLIIISSIFPFRSCMFVRCI